ncbi:hypothetical protein PQQ53_04635 [Paraburkholderia strydomiana]|jgi:hypothetical protein|uniref:Uncharacterized protein n=1 Tax=Paraburkholderia strydomiana TaxID=1245417 RepID=A0ABW9E9F8_9BURK
MLDHGYERLRDTVKLTDVLSENFDDRPEGTNGRSTSEAAIDKLFGPMAALGPTGAKRIA